LSVKAFVEVLALLAGAGAALRSGPDQRTRPHGSAGGSPMRPAGLVGAAVNAAPHERIRH
jgi:hypothetical protein